MYIPIKSSIVMNKSLYIFFASLLLAACAHTPQQAEADDQFEQPGQAEAPQEVTPQALPSVELSSELLYEYLLSEIAAQRGNDTLAVEGSLDLAKKTRDPRLAMRAAHMALQFGQLDKAVEALRIWRDTDPSSLMARRMLASVLLRGGRLDEAGEEFANLLKADESDPAQTFVQIDQMLVSYPD